jgi:hypothetical protein
MAGPLIYHGQGAEIDCIAISFFFFAEAVRVWFISENRTRIRITQKL